MTTASSHSPNKAVVVAPAEPTLTYLSVLGALSRQSVYESKAGPPSRKGCLYFLSQRIATLCGKEADLCLGQVGFPHDAWYLTGGNGC